MHTFEISIRSSTSGPDVFEVVVEQRGHAVALERSAKAMFVLGPDEESRLRVAAIEREPYGIILGEAVFQDAVSDLFDLARAEAEVDDPLHVFLSVEAESLLSLRWERLCAPYDLDKAWDFLALNPRTPFSLFLPSSTERRFPPIGRGDLRALVVVANPKGLDNYDLRPFDAREAADTARKALDSIPCEVLLSDGAKTIGSEYGPATLDELCDRIETGSFSLLHIVCHGGLVGDEAALVLADANGDVAKVKTTELLERLRRLDPRGGLPRLTFLASCYSATPEANGSGALGGLAQKLVQNLGLPAVLAMTDQITEKTALPLSSVFYRQLLEYGEPDRALVEATVGLSERHDILVPALYTCLRDRPLFSDIVRDLDKLTASEIEFGLGIAGAEMEIRSPRALLPEFAAAAEIVLDSNDIDRDQMSGVNRHEWEKSLARINELCDEALDVGFAAIAQRQAPAPFNRRRPFRGFESFRPEDSEFFFGRDTEIGELVNRLAEHPFLAILGPSGSGKTSLALAGLAAALQKKDASLNVRRLVIGANAPAELERTVRFGARTLIVVDQLEKIFLWQDEAERERLFREMANLAIERPVVVTLRDDYRERFAAYPALRDLIEEHHVVIEPLAPTELQRAAEQQAATVGLRFEPNLADQIVADLTGQPGAMPLLQQTLLELWNWRHGRWLSANEYRKLDGVQGIAVQGAQSAYEDHSSPEARSRMRDIFLRLIRLNDDAPGTGERDETARTVLCDDLVPAGDSPYNTETLVADLAAARVLTVGSSANPGLCEAEFAYEPLIQHWERLQNWIREDRSWLVQREKVREDAEDWERGGRDPELLLLRDRRLEQAEALKVLPRVPLNQRELDYLNGSRTLRDQEEARRRRWWYIASWGGALAAAIFLLVALWALRAQHRAEELTLVRLIEAIAAQSKVEHAAGNDDLAALLAREAYLLDQGQQTNESSVSGPVEEALRTAADVPFFSHRLPGDSAWVGAMAFHPDQSKLASANSDSTVSLWDLRRSGLPLRPTQLETALGDPWVASLAFSPDGHSLVTGEDDLQIRLWDVDSGKLIQTIRLRDSDPMEGAVRAIAFSPDGQTIASGGDDGFIHVWRRNGNEWVEDDPRELPPSHQVNTMAFSPDGQTLAWGTCSEWYGNRKERCTKGQIFRIDLGQDDRTPVPVGSAFGGAVWAVAFSEAGGRHYFAAGGCGDRQDAQSGPLCVQGQIRLFDPDNWEQEPGILIGHDVEVRSLAFSSDGRTLASGGHDGTVRLWNPMHTGEPAIVLAQSEGWVRGVAFSADRQWLASASVNGSIRLWELDPLADLPKRLPANGAWVYGLAFLPAAELPGEELRLAVADHGGRVGVWNLRHAENTPMDQWSSPNGGAEAHIRAATLGPDGKWLAWVNEKGEVRLWDQSKSASEVGVGDAIVAAGHDLWSVAIGEDISLVGTAGPIPDSYQGSKDTACLWNLTSGRPACQPLPGTNVAWTIALSPDDARVAVGSEDGEIRLWDLAHLEDPPIVLAGHERGVRALAFSPDGQVLVSGGHDKTVRIWSNLDQAEPDSRVLGTHSGNVRAIAFHPNGNLIATGGEDQTIRIWDLHHPGSGGATFGVEEDWVRALAFSPDGRVLAAGGADGTVRLWAGTAALLADEICDKVWIDDAVRRDWDAISERLVGTEGHPVPCESQSAS